MTTNRRQKTSFEEDIHVCILCTYILLIKNGFLKQHSCVYSWLTKSNFCPKTVFLCFLSEQFISQTMHYQTFSHRNFKTIRKKRLENILKFRLTALLSSIYNNRNLKFLSSRRTFLISFFNLRDYFVMSTKKIRQS